MNSLHHSFLYPIDAPPNISFFRLLSEMRALHFHCLSLVFISPPPLFPSCHSIALTCFTTARLLYAQLWCIPCCPSISMSVCLCFHDFSARHQRSYFIYFRISLNDLTDKLFSYTKYMIKLYLVDFKLQESTSK